MRQDIQALRGVAVLLVVVYHARLGLVPGGFLGVDIFFVISGFLITSMIKKQVERGSFSFIEFYYRRAKRLLPAAYVTFAFTAVLSAWLLTSNEFLHFRNQLAGAVTFTANIALWRQGTYFGGDADLKPLLHTWSLSIEEQYYLLMPALLFFLPRKWWTRAIVAILVGSLMLCIAVGLWKPAIAFYLFPTRAWELAIGSFGAMVGTSAVAQSWSERFYWPSIAVMALLPLWPIDWLQPGIDAVLVCFATLALILSNRLATFQTRACRVLSWVGDISYSLYLVHWPLFALATNLWMEEVPLGVRLAIIPISILLAWLQYRYVENPIRHSDIRPRRRFIVPAAVASMVLIAFPIAFANAPATREFSHIRRPNVGLSASCAYSGDFVPKPECRTSDSPKVLVWGDSYAMHMVPGIAATRGRMDLEQATKYVCGPFAHIAPMGISTGATQNRLWSKQCLNFNKSVMAHVRNSPSLEIVVLSSVFKTYMTPERWRVVSDVPGNPTFGGVEQAITEMRRTVVELRSMGKKVVVLGPPPALDWDAGRCNERLLRGLPLLGRYADCSVPEDEYLELRANVLEFLQRLPTEADVNVIAFDERLRHGKAFATRHDQVIDYIADGHFSNDGSLYIADHGALMQRIVEQAR